MLIQPLVVVTGYHMTEDNQLKLSITGQRKLELPHELKFRHQYRLLVCTFSSAGCLVGAAGLRHDHGLTRVCAMVLTCFCFNDEGGGVLYCCLRTHFPPLPLSLPPSLLLLVSRQ